MWQFVLALVAFVAAVALIMWWLRTPPLHEAVEEGDLTKVKALLGEGADVNSVAYSPGKSSEGRTPLHLAARRHSPEIVEYLIKNGADVKARTPRMLDTPLHYAAVNKWREGTKIAEILLQRGASIDERNIDAYTPLHFAVEDGSREMVELLLRAGANLDSRTNRGLTLLHCAARGNNRPAAELLVSKGVDPGAKDAEGRTPLALAIASNAKDTAEFLQAVGPTAGKRP